LQEIFFNIFLNVGVPLVGTLKNYLLPNLKIINYSIPLIIIKSITSNINSIIIEIHTSIN